MNNAERFLNAYATIEHEMQRILDLKERRRFYELVEMGARGNPVLRRYKFDLKKFGDLRNAIVHDRADGKIIAEPTIEAVESIETIARLLLEPPRVAPLFIKEVLALPGEAPVIRAVRELSRHNYTQLAVIDGGAVVAMLTANMIVHWLGRSPAATPDLLERTSIREVLRQTGDRDNFRVVAAEASLFQVLDLFIGHQAKGKKLDAVLITAHGRPEEELIGIITNRDLPLLQKELDRAASKSRCSW